MKRKQNIERSLEQIIGTAYHEAGHAVAALVLGVPINGIWVSRYECSVPGEFWHPSPSYIECSNGCERRSNARACIIVAYSGVPAERLYDPDAPYSGYSDDAYVKKTSRRYEVYPRNFGFAGDEHCDAYLERLRREARRLARRHESKIACLAKALHQHPKLQMLPDEIRSALSQFSLAQ